MKKSELSAMTVADLKALARKKKIQLPSDAKKAEIVAALVKTGPAASSRSTAAAAVRTAGKKKAPKKAAKKASKKTAKQAVRKTVRKPARRLPAVEPPAERWEMPPGAEEPLMAQDRVTQSKYYTGPSVAVQAPRDYAELPSGYGEDQIAMMARDPHVAYAYWEVTPARLEKEKAWFGWDSTLCVRIYDVTGVQFDGRNASAYYDQDVTDRIGSWYFDIQRPNHSFCADIGLRSPRGGFLTLARSNYITLPRDGASDVVDEEWMVTEEEFLRLYGIAEGLSSEELGEIWKKRRMHGLFSPGISSQERNKGQ